MTAEAPTIMDYPRQILAVVGSDVIIPCRSRGAPLPTVTWYRNGAPLGAAHETVTRPAKVKFGVTSGTLYAALGRCDNGANFTCRFRNDAGSASATARLAIRFTPELYNVSVSHESTSAGV